MDNTDDEALNWAGDDARQRGGGTWSVPERRGGASLSPSSTDSTRGQAPRGSSDGEAVVSRPTTVGDSVALVATGVFAGIYLLFTVAWLITALRNPVVIADPLGRFMFDMGTWLAVAAGPAFFIASLIAGNSRLVLRFVWLCAGALVLIPWPYFTWAG